MISVLMSVYNESLSDIRKSIDSILNQTCKDFEFIIVLDNPSYSEAQELLDAYAKKDDRIKILVNEENIGLAMSMNRAAELAAGKYLLRMDADDISLPERFQTELQVIESLGCDLVCTDYDFIDENDASIERKTDVYTGNQISKLLPYRNVIHHPTVIMRAELFHKVGGYRNYQCAQDYDLWLRLKLAGCKFHMIHQKLLHYRVRSTSTTIKHRYKQVCTRDYIQHLYKNKMLGYSYEGYLEYLKEKQAENPEIQADYERNSALYVQAKGDLKSGRLFTVFRKLFKVLFCSKYYKANIFKSLWIYAVKKFVK